MKVRLRWAPPMMNMSRRTLVRPLARSLVFSQPICMQKPSVRLRYQGAHPRKAHTMPNNPIFQAILKHNPQSTAVVHSESGRTFTYGSLLHDVAAAKDRLLQTADGMPLAGERIAFLAENGYDYVGVHWTACSLVQ